MMELNWIKCRGNVWCRLNEVNLETVPDDEGVYVIWYEDTLGDDQCVYVGQGVIKDRLEYHRSNDDVQIYEISGELRVTWALVPAKRRAGVEKYLSDQLDPSVGERHPDVPPIAVNLPF